MKVLSLVDVPEHYILSGYVYDVLRDLPYLDSVIIESKSGPICLRYTDVIFR